MSVQNLSNQDANQQKWKVKEPISTLELKSILMGWLAAIDEERDFEFQIKGQRCRVPSKALLSNKTLCEFEMKDGEFEFELELKWKNDSTKIQ